MQGYEWASHEIVTPVGAGQTVKIIFSGTGTFCRSQAGTRKFAMSQLHFSIYLLLETIIGVVQKSELLRLPVGG
jgi:hypothetical protein